jgi:DNA-binding FadR family transcriptional regulator
MGHGGEFTVLDRSAPGKERLHRAIAHRIGLAIVSGQLKPTQGLDNEVEASGKLEVSRSAYREAMRMLAAKGLVESRPRAGTQVSERRRWNLLDPEVLAWFFEAGTPDMGFVKALFELRMIIEPSAAALAAERRTQADLVRMREALMSMEKHGVGVEAGRIADRNFHDALLEATSNELLLSLASTIGAAVRWTTLFKQRSRPLSRDPMPEHWRVYDSIAVGDAQEAQAAMRALVDQALQDTQRELLG